MEAIELWRWHVTDEITGKRRLTRYLMSEADALARHGADAVRDEGSKEVRTRIGGAGDIAFPAKPPEA